MLLVIKLIKEFLGLARIMGIIGFRELVEFARELGGRDGSVLLGAEGRESGDK